MNLKTEGMENYAERYDLWDDEQYHKAIVKVSSRHLKLNDLLHDHFICFEEKQEIASDSFLERDKQESIKNIPPSEK